jgi:hypothetical protein
VAYTLTTAFRSWETRVKAECGHKFKTWRSWKAGETQADDPPATNLCPYIRLTPVVSNSTRIVSCGDVTESLVPIRVLVEIYTAGMSWDAICDLWGSLHDAMFPDVATDRRTLDAALRATGVDDVKVTRPALPSSPADFSGALVRGVGEINLNVKVQS